MRSSHVKTFLLLAGLCTSVWAGDKIPLQDLPKHAIEQSQITLPGSSPFHLKAKIFEKTDRHNDSHDAEVVEDWVAPDKWRRTITANGFSEHIVVNGEKVSQRLDGDYYPIWLRTLVNGIFSPGAALGGVDLTKSGDTARLERSPDGKFRVAAQEGPHVCRRFAFRISTPTASNTIFATYCFLNGLLESIGSPGYDVSYENYKEFAGKDVARKLGEYLEPGTELEADIEELSALTTADESLFDISQPNPQLSTVVVAESTLRNMILSAPDIQWPPMNGGRNPGHLSIYVCIDKQGRVRETYALNSDSPDMALAARQQVMKWSFKPAVTKEGQGVQIESVLTFDYQAPAFPETK
jgi:Gram-negative bacterial TonB protein C-terminal